MIIDLNHNYPTTFKFKSDGSFTNIRTFFHLQIKIILLLQKIMEEIDVVIFGIVINLVLSAFCVWRRP